MAVEDDDFVLDDERRDAADFGRVSALLQDNPQEAMKLLRKLREKVRVPHAGQVPVLESKARYRVMNCGRRWGKTVLAAKIFTQKARKPNQMLWWVAPTYKIVKRGYAETLRQLPDGVLTHDPPPESHFDAGRSVVLRFKNGTRMEFYSAERPEGMLGEGVDFAVLDEAAIMPGRVFNQIVRPTLMDRKGGALMISTPRGRNWFYKAWQQGQDDKNPDWESWTFTSYDNPTLPDGEVDDAKATTPRLEFEQEYLAKFLAAGSSVFLVPERSIQSAAVYNEPGDARTGLVEGTPPAGFVVLGIDLAKSSDWTVLYGCNARTRRNCYFERLQALTWPEQKRRIKRAVRTLKRNGATGVMLVMDSTGVGDPIVDDMEEAGYDVIGLNFTTHKTNMVRLLAKDLEESRAFVLDTEIDEFLNYGMSITPAGKITYSAPEGEHDDVVSAKMLQHWGCVNEGVPEVQSISPLSPDEEAQVADARRADPDAEWLDLIESSDEEDADFELDDDEAYDAIGLPNVYSPTMDDAKKQQSLLINGWW